MDNKERFISLCKKVNRPGMDELMQWLEDNKFYTSPASTKYHGAYDGGLLDHSLNVYDELNRLLSAYPEISVSEESKIICSLFHDLCKVNMYAKEKRNRKNSKGQWESYDAYDVEGDSATTSLSLNGTLTPEPTITGKVDTMTMRVFENEDIDVSSESLDNFLEQFVKE